MSSTRSHPVEDHSYGSTATCARSQSEDICKICKVEVKEGEKALNCNRCKTWQHITCAKVSNNDYKVIKKQTSLMWFCPENCLEKAESMFNGMASGSMAELNSKIDMLVKGFADLKLANDHKEEVLDRKIEDKVREIMKEVKETDFRKLNLIAFNVPETPDSTSEEKLAADLLFLNDVINELKLDAHVTEVMRHGKVERDRRRPLQFSVRNTGEKSKILSEARNLKSAVDTQFHKIYIVPDRTPKQREVERRLVTEMKRRRLAGESVRIVNGEVRSYPPPTRGATVPGPGGSGRADAQ